ncbi:hypothetical protein ACH5RR_016365 [Cinchona calisaya]|uniref:Uncharacterized protein n=1 Tax=Cinchona calisaya TaxID=153742 RepID=A0ABD2ZVN7_9GENT
MAPKEENDASGKFLNSIQQDDGDENEMDMKVKKYHTGQSANLELAVREDLYGKSAKAATKIEKWLMPSEGGYLEAEGIEKTWRINQESIAQEVDILSSRNQYDIVLPDVKKATCFRVKACISLFVLCVTILHG